MIQINEHTEIKCKNQVGNTKEQKQRVKLLGESAGIVPRMLRSVYWKIKENCGMRALKCRRTLEVPLDKNQVGKAFELQSKRELERHSVKSVRILPHGRWRMH